MLDAYADFLAGHRSFARIVQREIASGRHVERIVERTLPVFQLGMAWLNTGLSGPSRDLEPVHLLTTVYGMVATWCTHGEVLRRLTGRDPFSRQALEARKRHVRTVAALLLSQLEPRSPT